MKNILLNKKLIQILFVLSSIIIVIVQGVFFKSYMNRKLLKKIQPLEMQVKNNNKKLSALALKNNWFLDFTYNINGISYIFRDLAFSNTHELVVKELQNEYKMLDNINFQENDVIVDIGANIGIISIYLAKKYPNTKIYAYEPSQINFKNLSYNIEKNNITNVKAFNYGLGGREEKLSFKFTAENSGGASAFFYKNESESDLFFEETIKIYPLTKILSDSKIKKIKLLKVDCEGCEFDMFENMSDNDIKNIEHLLVEAHCLNENDEKRWNNILEKLYRNIDKNKISYTSPHPDFCQQSKK